MNLCRAAKSADVWEFDAGLDNLKRFANESEVLKRHWTEGLLCELIWGGDEGERNSTTCPSHGGAPAGIYV